MTLAPAERTRPVIGVRTAHAIMRRILRAAPLLAPLAGEGIAFADYTLSFALGERSDAVPELRGALETAALRYREAVERGGYSGAAVPERDTGVRPFAPLSAFACAALAYAAQPSDAALAPVIDSIYSTVASDDARAFVTVAAGRTPLLQALGSGVVALDFERRSAVQRFVAAVESLARAFRAQGCGAAELAETLILAFSLEADANANELAALAELRACALAVDEARKCTSDAWEPSEVVALIDGALETTPPTHPANDRENPNPLGRRAPEERTAVTRQRSHFSASALKTYSECERKWYYRYVCAAVEDRGSAASFYGTAFHNALEAFHKEFPRGDTASLQTLASKLDAQLNSAFERVRLRFETEVEYALQLRRARRTGRRYLDWFVTRSRATPFSVVGEELPADLELEGYSFVGFIDRLDRDDATGGVTVVDYKTGSIALSASEYRNEVRGLTEFQLPYYYWACTAMGKRVVRLSLIPLKDALLPVRPIELEVVPVAAANGRDDAPVGTIGIDELERARTRMLELARTLSDTLPEHFPVTRDPDACTYCSYRAACRERPRRSEKRFAR